MQIIYLLLELIPCLAFGYFLGRFKTDFSFLVSRKLIKFGIPISIMGLLLKTGLNLKLIESALIALLAIGLLIAMINSIPSLKDNLNSKVLQFGTCFGNTGYFGIPVSLALLPNEALVYSMGFDLGATLVIWSLGPLMLNKNTYKRHEIKDYLFYINSLTNSPAIKGLIGALIIKSTPWSDQITSTLWIPTRIVIVFALVVVGMRLGLLSISTFSTIGNQIRSIRKSLILKLICFPALMFSLCLILQLPNDMKNALVLQASAPTAISVLLIAQANSQGEDKATLLVILSTLIALITIPIWSLMLDL